MRTAIISTAIVLCAALVVTLGACSPVRVNTSTTIDRPAGEAWAAFANADRLDEWMHDNWDGDLLHWADAPPEALDEPREVTFEEDGERMTLIQTVTTLEDGRAFGFTFEHDWADVEFLFAFEPVDDTSCTMTLDFVADPNGWNGIWMHLSKGSINDRLSDHLARFKAAVESD